jgi:hypothetical protein
MRAEEVAFYPFLAVRTQSVNLTLEAFREHREAENSLISLLIMPVDDKNWAKTCKTLKGQVEHHIEDEESKVFDSAKKFISHVEIKAVHEQFTVIKESSKAIVKMISLVLV